MIKIEYEDAEDLDALKEKLEKKAELPQNKINQIIKKAQQNAKCEINFIPKKLSEDKDNLTNISEDVKKIKQKIVELRKQMKKELNYNEEDVPDDKSILEKLHEENYDLVKEIRGLGYIAIAQMYEGILLDEQISFRKGKIFEYRKQGEIYYDEFLQTFYENRVEIYKKLGKEKALIIEEFFQRLINLNIIDIKIEEDEKDNKWRRKQKFDASRTETLSVSSSEYYYNSTYLYRWEFENKKIKEKLKNMFKIVKLKEPLKVITKNNDDYCFLIVTKLKFTPFTINFYGYDENTLKKLNLDDLSLKYVNEKYKNIIFNEIEPVYNELLKQQMMFKQTIEDLNKKLAKYLLIAKMRNIDIKQRINRNW